MASSITTVYIAKPSPEVALNTLANIYSRAKNYTAAVTYLQFYIQVCFFILFVSGSHCTTEFPPITVNCDVWPWLDGVQVKPALQSRPQVVWFKNYCPETHMHTHPTNCFTTTTKLIGNQRTHNRFNDYFSQLCTTTPLTQAGVELF